MLYVRMQLKLLTTTIQLALHGCISSHYIQEQSEEIF